MNSYKKSSPQTSPFLPTLEEQAKFSLSLLIRGKWNISLFPDTILGNHFGTDGLTEAAQAHLDAKAGFLCVPASRPVVSSDEFRKTIGSRLCVDSKCTGQLPYDALDIVAALS